MPSGCSCGAAAHWGRWGELSLFSPSSKRDLTIFCLASSTRAAQGDRDERLLERRRPVGRRRQRLPEQGCVAARAATPGRPAGRRRRRRRDVGRGERGGGPGHPGQRREPPPQGGVRRRRGRRRSAEVRLPFLYALFLSKCRSNHIFTSNEARWWRGWGWKTGTGGRRRSAERRATPPTPPNAAIKAGTSSFFVRLVFVEMSI